MSELPRHGRRVGAAVSSAAAWASVGEVRQARAWVTPTVEDGGRSGDPEWAAKWAAGVRVPDTHQRLRTQAHWPSPAANHPSTNGSPPTCQRPFTARQSLPKRQLSAAWVENLMGFPPDWTIIR